MLLSCQNISKAFVGKQILSEISFHIEDYDKVALIGMNGAGKSTLLKIIIGELEPDSGVVAISKDKTMGYLSQHQDLSTENSIYDELLLVKKDILDMEQRIRQLEKEMHTLEGAALEQCMNQYSSLTHQFEMANGYAYKSELTGVLKGLGFEESEFDKKVSTLSGGQKTRVALGKLLLQKPDFIILDEPTNHLDMASINWLETYLLNYKGAVLIVSHDRYFLDRIASKVIEIENTKAMSFTGNYSQFAQKKAIVRNAQMQAYLNQQKEIKHQEEVIEKLKSFNREKSIKRAESREKMLNKIEVIDKPVELDGEMKLKLTPRILSGNDVLTITDLSKSFGSHTLFTNANIDIKRGEHVAIIGKNGTGKTTLLKIINDLESFDTGEIKLGSKVEIGYYDQEHHVLHEEKTLFEEISDDYEYLTNTEIRNTLAAFLFTGEDVFKRIKDLSGGERGRVSLAKLMLSNANFIILDEPTNHLDIASKEILEEALNNYEGTILYVSHDRYFINKTASRILDLTENGFENYIGNYDYYLEKVTQREMQQAAASQNTTKESAPASDSQNKLSWQEQKEQQALKRKQENALKKVEEEIDQVETALAELEEKLNDPEIATNLGKLSEITKEQEKLNTRLEELMNKWEELA